MKKILIIEDDAKVASALNIRISNAGYETVLAADALSAVSVAVAAQPDLALVDINMPAGNGFTVVERIRSLVPGKLPVIFITASKEPGLVERALEAGASGYIEKPYNPMHLLTLLENVLSKPAIQAAKTRTANREAAHQHVELCC